MEQRKERSLLTKVLLVAGIVGLGLTASACKGKTCPGRFDALASSMKDGQATCNCAPGASGSVWGTSTYTTDSSICAAAVHAGAVPLTGGPITVKPAAGCPSYKGTTANGMTSSQWGPFASSFFFPGHGDGTCSKAGPDDPCPARFADSPEAVSGADFACTCAAGATGSVWGDAIYTTDSSLCAAAVHAGAIPVTGGKIAVKKAAGCSTYTGSTKNGVTTSSWPSFGSSFYFPANGGTGTCGAAPTAAATAATPSTPTASKSVGKCGSFNALPGAAAGPVTCTCDGPTGGTVWGDVIYTRDSPICKAGIHAGALPASGKGDVTVLPAPGCPSYNGTTKNGITTNKWAKYGGSYYFKGKGSGVCN